MRNISLDLETMGVTSGAPVLAIGAVEFDTEHGVTGRAFYATIGLADAVAHGGKMDADTVLWWLRQSDAARQELTGKTGSTVDVLQAFTAWVEAGGVPHDHRRVWGNGPRFDCGLLAETYARVGLAPPWPHWGERCFRTVRDLRPDLPVERVGVHHNAHADALTQAVHMLKILAQSPTSQG